MSRGEVLANGIAIERWIALPSRTARNGTSYIVAIAPASDAMYRWAYVSKNRFISSLLTPRS